MILSLFGASPKRPQCSRAGCRADATLRIEWRNPKIHDETRRKVWLACEDHGEFLRGFLESRNFPVSVTPFTEEEPRE